MMVKKLIRELKKMPQDMEVAFACHDNSEGEIQGVVSRLWIEEETDSGVLGGNCGDVWDRDFVPQLKKKMGRRYVVLRP